MKYGVLVTVPLPSQSGQICIISDEDIAVFNTLDEAKHYLDKLMKKHGRLCSVTIYDLEYELKSFCDLADYKPSICR